MILRKRPSEFVVVDAKIHDRAHWPSKLGGHAVLQGLSLGEKYTEKLEDTLQGDKNKHTQRHGAGGQENIVYVERTAIFI